MKLTISSLKKVTRNRIALVGFVLALFPVQFLLTGCGGAAGTAGSVSGGASTTQVVAESGKKIMLTADQFKTAGQEDAKRQATLATIATIEKNLKVQSDGTLALAPKETRSVVLSPEQEQFAQIALAKTNSMVQAGTVTVDEKFILHPTTTTRDIGRNYLTLHWWGFDLGVTADTAKKLVHILLGLEAGWIEIVSDYDGVWFHETWWGQGWIWFE
jgi:hypothetical protein